MSFPNIHPDVEREAEAVKDELIGDVELINIAHIYGDKPTFTYRYNGEEVTFTVYSPSQLNARDLAAELIASLSRVESEVVMTENLASELPAFEPLAPEQVVEIAAAFGVDPVDLTPDDDKPPAENKKPAEKPKHGKKNAK